MTLQGMPGMMVQSAGGQVTQNFQIRSTYPFDTILVFRPQFSILGSPLALVDLGWLGFLEQLLPQSHLRFA